MSTKKYEISSDAKEVAHNLMRASMVAKELFNYPEPTGDMILGVHDRVFSDLELDEDDHKDILQDLKYAKTESDKLLAAPSPDFVFGVYDRMFTDLFCDD